MDGFAGYRTAAAAVVPDAVTVMDPFHVVALAGAKLDLIRQRIQQQTLGRRGHAGDPLYGIRRIARTRARLLSQRQYHRLTSVLAADEHIAVKVAWLIYQKIIAVYADPDRRTGKRATSSLIESIRRGVPAGLAEIEQLGRNLWRRRHDILAFFDHHASTDHPKRSTDASKHSGATRSDSATSPTTDCAQCCTAAHSTNSSTHSEFRSAVIRRRAKALACHTKPGIISCSTL
jgi:transposase